MENRLQIVKDCLKSNIVPFSEKMEIGTTYWITGLSGAGKTTIGKMLYAKLKDQKDNIVFLDGDILREVYQSTDYSNEGRKKLAFQHARLCRMLNEQNIDVVICVIAMYDDCREWNRNNIKNYKEIYLNVPIEELIRRDQKQLYSKALRNEMPNVLGINMEYEEPKHPDFEIENAGINNPNETLKKIMEKFNL